MSTVFVEWRRAALDAVATTGFLTLGSDVLRATRALTRNEALLPLASDAIFRHARPDAYFAWPVTRTNVTIAAGVSHTTTFLAAARPAFLTLMVNQTASPAVTTFLATLCVRRSFVRLGVA